ncbi:hypothetical protein BEN47_15520 [Hymenobacter lapidarius]|uniref:Uncharacterized protein n=1 Tax=Hymenobacter lapidarius TaxID=1908237 RepID=A0A1G1T283_9BACT|nr:hypothetical protein [Hymenobacter lapidarius]OGX84966.1 hypothetical protein BEN47_15520 [Hymenobacter lapidarius]
MFLLFLMFPLLPGLVLLCVLVRLVAPRRRRLQRVAVGITLGCWAGFFLADQCDWDEWVRQTKLTNPNAHAALRGMGFSGSHDEWTYFWNGLVIAFWLALVLGALAYWSGPRVKARTPEAIP